MRRIGRKSRSAIGLDLGARHVTAVQLEATGAAVVSRGGAPSGWRVAAATRVSRTRPGEPLGPDEAARLRATLDRVGFLGADVVLAAPPEGVLSGVLELPPRTAQIPLAQIARVEFARTNKCAPDSFEMGCWELPAPARAGKSTHVMAVGYPHAEATELLDRVESAGFNIVALDVRCCALARACAAMASEPPGITALLDLGWTSASLALMHAGMVVYVRALPESGTGGLCQALAARLKLEPEMIDYLLAEVGLRDAQPPDPGEGSAAVDDADRLALPDEARGAMSHYADALVRDLLVSFSYVARQYTDATVARLLLVGPGASVPGLGQYLAKELGLETRVVSPKDLTECPPALLDVCSSPELTPAAGMAQFPET
jgi:type IV pilus assembly protein PilM